MAKCRATTQDGRPCDANAGRSGFCFFHDPAQAEANAEAKAKGKVRMEGKDYVMADGDVVEFRFNV